MDEHKEEKKAEVAPETLLVKSGNVDPAKPAAVKPVLTHAIRSYRPSHKATFIGIAVVVVILAINVAVIMFFLKPQSEATQAKQGSVTVSADALSKLGVNRDSVGASDSELTINPNSQFKGNVTVANDVNVAGQLKLNGTFAASNAMLAKLQAGDTSVNSLNVNGDGAVTSLSLRKDLAVSGSVRVNGTTTISGLTTVNNSLNVSGNLSVGGTVSLRSIEGSSVVADNILAIGGHVITRGTAPGIGPGTALGSNGTVSISGNDASGTVAVNAGTNAGSGILAQVAFRTAYGSTPHVLVTPIGAGVSGFYVNRTAYGFSIGVSSGLSPGGYAFDYWVVQ